MKIPGFPGDRDKKSTSTGRKSYFLIPPLALWHPWWHQFMDRMVIFLTVMLCLLMLPTRLPGMELLGIGPNWLLIWVVAWSVNRSVFSGLLSGIILGLLQDAMTSPDPTHALSLGIVGMLTALMQKQRFIQEDFISIALIVFSSSESIGCSSISLLVTLKMLIFLNCARKTLFLVSSTCDIQLAFSSLSNLLEVIFRIILSTLYLLSFK